MVLTYHGDNYFKIQSGSFTMLIDPTNQRSFKGANLVLNTLKPPLAERPPRGSAEEQGPVWIENQGEYESSGVEVRGVSIGVSAGPDGKPKEKTAYKVMLDEITIGVLGFLSKTPNEEAMEILGGVDLLIVPAGGKYIIGAKEAATVIKSLSPKIVVVAPLGNPKDLLDELDGGKVSPEEKLTLKKKDFEGKEMEAHMLKI